MPSIYQLKPAFQNLLRPLVRTLAAIGVTANMVTVAAMLLSVAVGMLLWKYAGERWVLWLLPTALLVRMALNAVDGMLAREHNMQTRLGAFLNELGDVVSDSALYLGFGFVVLSLPFAMSLIVLLVVLAITSEMTGVLAQALGGTRRYDGPMGKSDRAFWISLIAVLLAGEVEAGLWVSIALGLIALMTALTIVNRVGRAIRETERVNK